MSEVAIEQQKIRNNSHENRFPFVYFICFSLACRWFALFQSFVRFNRVCRSIWCKHIPIQKLVEEKFFHIVLHSRKKANHFHLLHFSIVLCCTPIFFFWLLCFDNLRRYQKNCDQHWLKAHGNMRERGRENDVMKQIPAIAAAPTEILKLNQWEYETNAYIIYEHRKPRYTILFIRCVSWINCISGKVLAMAIRKLSIRFVTF